MPADIACVSFEYSGLHLTYGPPEVVPLLRQALSASWTKGIDSEWSINIERPLEAAFLSTIAGGLVSHKFGLNDSPWNATSSESATLNRWMVATILQTMSAAGWRVIASPMVGKTIKRCDDLFFVRSVPNPMPFVSVALWSYDSILVVAPTNIGKPVVEAVRGAIASHWPQGIQRQKATGIMSKFKLKGYPWQMNNKDAVDARLLVKHIIEAMHAAGYDLVTCNGVEPWIYEKDKKNPRADTMFFQMRSDGPPLESLPPSYEEAVAETSGPTGFGGMAGSPQPLAPFPQPAIDMSDLTLLALHDAESIILVSSQSQILSPAVLQTINTVLPNGLKEEQIKQGTVYAVPRFKLKGNPFWYGYTAPVASKRLIVTLLARFANYGLRVVTDVSTMSTSKVSTFVFGNAPPVRRAPHFGLAFSDVNKIQLIALNKGDPNALTALEMLYAESVIVETLQEITARDCVRDDLDGVIEWTAPRESFDLQSNDSDSMRRTRLFVGLVIAGMASLGWAVVSTPSLGVYGQQSDVVVFARFE